MRKEDAKLKEMLNAAIESYKEMADYGGNLGIRVTIENHWGLAADPQNIRIILDEVNRVEVTGTSGRITADWRTMTVMTVGESGLPSALGRFTGALATALDLTRCWLRNLMGALTSNVEPHAGLRIVFRRQADGSWRCVADMFSSVISSTVLISRAFDISSWPSTTVIPSR